MKTDFPTDYASIRAQLESFDPARYGKTRNFLNGGVSRLSAYITHGVLSVAEVGHVAASRYGVQNSAVFAQELAWREYFHHVWEECGDALFEDIYRPQPTAERSGVPTALLGAETGINAIDEGVRDLLTNGYLHNHERLWIASLACNIARVHWREPAWWFYYYLLDGDLASNTLGWQWVAGTFGAKLYYANQENINKFSGTTQRGTYLDCSYDELHDMAIPDVLSPVSHLDLKTILPSPPPIVLTEGLPLLLYHAWSLDPTWHANEAANRVLVLEPSHFAAFPMGERRINFIMELASNISGLQVFCGEVDDLPGLEKMSSICSKAYQATRHFPGTKEPVDRLFEWPEDRPIARSFSGYWKVVGDQARDFGRFSAG